MASTRLSHKSRPEKLMGAFAQALILSAIAISTWNIGGTPPGTLVYLTPILIACCVIAIFNRRALFFRYQVLPVSCLLLVFAWNAWLAIQLIPLPNAWLALIAPGTVRIDEQYLQPIVSALDQGLATLGDQTDVAALPRTISIIPQATAKVLGVSIVASAMFLLGAIYFDSRTARKVLLWGLLINSAVMAGWGVVQRASGSRDLLPGYTLPQVRVPFGPFIYKNAGPRRCSRVSPPHLPWR